MARRKLFSVIVVVSICILSIIVLQRFVPIYVSMHGLTRSAKLPWDTNVRFQKLIDQENYLMLPEDEVLLKMNRTLIQQTFWRYIHSIQTLCHRVERYGNLRDGGKEVCLDDQFSLRPPCLVLSFGINNDFSFDDDMLDKHGCQVYSFDPSMKRESYHRKSNNWFYKIGLGARNYTDHRQWPILTLGAIRKMIGHEKTIIDVLKIDIEGDEWDTLHQMIASRDIFDVKQILIELHLEMGNPKTNKLAAIRDLYKAGFRICMRERNLSAMQQGRINGDQWTTVVELTLLKVI